MQQYMPLSPYDKIQQNFFDHKLLLNEIGSSGWGGQNAKLAQYAIHDHLDEDYQNIAEIIMTRSLDKLSQQQNRAFACFLGNALGDSLGAHTEFEHFDHEKDPSQNTLKSGWDDFSNMRQRTTLGIVTDDCSMARCVADSLICNEGQFNGIDLRARFLLWWHLGYNNTSKNDTSFGLGGNISEGFQQFKQQWTPKVSEQRGQISGNGSIMRLSPVPICFWDNLELGLQYADDHSMSTHNGGEAADLCRMLTFLCIKLINYKGNDPKQDIFVTALRDEFYPTVKSQGVQYMAISQMEPAENIDLFQYNKSFNRSEYDRNWNWRQKELKPSPIRKKQQPGYFGSYAMDGAYIALHTIYHATSLKEAIFKAVNYGGDADSIAAVVGYLGGAMWGLDNEVLDLYFDKMFQFDELSLFVKAQKLYSKNWYKTNFRYLILNPQQDQGQQQQQFLQECYEAKKIWENRRNSQEVLQKQQSIQQQIQVVLQGIQNKDFKPKQQIPNQQQYQMVISNINNKYNEENKNQQSEKQSQNDNGSQQQQQQFQQITDYDDSTTIKSQESQNKCNNQSMDLE